jgi:hypothetical protein
MPRATVGPVIVLLVVLVCAPAARAASTRAEYVAQVDPICHAADLKGKRAAKKHHLPRVIDLGDLQLGERDAQLTVAKQLALNNKVIRPFIAQVAAVPPPPGDEGVISKFIADLHSYTVHGDKAVRAIRHGKPHRAYHLIVAALGPLVEDNENLKPFGFQYCTT